MDFNLFLYNCFLLTHFANYFLNLRASSRRRRSERECRKANYKSRKKWVFQRFLSPSRWDDEATLSLYIFFFISPKHSSLDCIVWYSWSALKQKPGEISEPERRKINEISHAPETRKKKNAQKVGQSSSVWWQTVSGAPWDSATLPKKAFAVIVQHLSLSVDAHNDHAENHWNCKNRNEVHACFGKEH